MRFILLLLRLLLVLGMLGREYDDEERSNEPPIRPPVTAKAEVVVVAMQISSAAAKATTFFRRERNRFETKVGSTLLMSLSAPRQGILLFERSIVLNGIFATCKCDLFRAWWQEGEAEGSITREECCCVLM